MNFTKRNEEIRSITEKKSENINIETKTTRLTEVRSFFLSQDILLNSSFTSEIKLQRLDNLKRINNRSYYNLDVIYNLQL
jgi:hypothetical protein